MAMTFLQIELPGEASSAAMPAATAAVSEPTQETLSIMDLMLSGGIGGQIIMLLMVLLSIAMVYIFVNRMGAIKRANKIDPQFMKDIKDHVASGNVQSAINLCERSDSPVARMILKGLTRIGKPLQDISASIENQGKLEIQRLERNLPYLATIAGGAPMLGLLGTVIGMILAFKEMANAGGGVQIDMLAEGIYVAMTTTAAGLVVGIFAYFGYNFLVTRVESVIYKMETSSTEFLDLLDEPV
ncbi:MAG: MotA/TolQ/ExbB proton channel family protein [Bacteroidetes bacterium]|jgi:biopolymer transport protein ExbB|nr:MotA/TolQ/ExbB proton channel family protein [Bacteroidota bacterium]NCZ95477.1 MotA/TolQ/ExbB proton channel family protein [Flavobacteriia bacterium]MDA1199104.1 MotA/TolQ/ExbB proton channel family protein [Bacteroidota bacterium]NDA07585.1 MotA/TolQ/ExbB proton channel family protein [Flavobacteriia bacterium]NDA27792.1 MotA/TolQ/ExbB proton channel family protein [Flavobacteriia bacterium]